MLLLLRRVAAVVGLRGDSFSMWVLVSLVVGVLVGALYVGLAGAEPPSSSFERSVVRSVGDPVAEFIPPVRFPRQGVAASVPLREISPTARAAADDLGPGINLGNSLDAPREGDWGPGLDAEYFRLIAEAGFEHIRLPVSWADYAAEEAPFTIPTGNDPTVTHPDYNNIWERVDWAIDQALANDLRIVVNMHHYDEAQANPLAHRDRIIGMWEQIAPHYADQPDEVYFELFNEPYDQFTEQPELWNDLLADLLDVVRQTNPTRPVLIGPVGFNKVDFLPTLVLPEDPNIIVTVHVYEPFTFTHQGATWIDPAPPLGVPWAEDSIAVPDGLLDRSWGTRAITENGTLRLDFSGQWTGYSLDWGRVVEPTSMTFEAWGSTEIRVGCRGPEIDTLDVQRFQLTEEPQRFEADLTICPENTSGFAIMNQTENLDPVRISRLEVCTRVTGCTSMFNSGADALRERIDRAAAWSEANGYPIHIGEFGAFSGDPSGVGPVPLVDRAGWTSTLVEVANSHDIPFSYWEFHSGYAAYNLEEQAWVEEIREALLGSAAS